MSTSIAIPRSSFAASIEGALVKGQPRSTGSSISFSGPSPFEIPQSITVRISQDGKLAFDFDYPDKESPEAVERVAAVNGDVSVLLAEITKKVLSVKLERRVEEILQTRFSSVNLAAVQFDAPLQRQAANSFNQNAVLVTDILRAMPLEIRTQILHGYRTLATHKSAVR